MYNFSSQFGEEGSGASALSRSEVENRAAVSLQVFTRSKLAIDLIKDGDHIQQQHTASARDNGP